LLLEAGMIGAFVALDLFVFYDDVQYTKNDWRNRNKVKGPTGTQWLTIPVGDNLHRLICEVDIQDARWQIKTILLENIL